MEIYDQELFDKVFNDLAPLKVRFVVGDKEIENPVSIDTEGKTYEEILAEYRKIYGEEFRILEEEIDIGPSVGEEQWWKHEKTLNEGK